MSSLTFAVVQRLRWQERLPFPQFEMCNLKVGQEETLVKPQKLEMGEQAGRVGVWIWPITDDVPEEAEKRVDKKRVFMALSCL